MLTDARRHNQRRRIYFLKLIVDIFAINLRELKKNIVSNYKEIILL